MLSVFKRKPEAERTSSDVRLAKLILWQAVTAKATKVVFGEPSETGCKKIKFDPTVKRYYDTPWEKEDAERSLGYREERYLEGKQARQCPDGSALPVWHKVGDTYTETCPIPKGLFLRVITLFESWKDKIVPCNLDNFFSGEVRLSDAGLARTLRVAEQMVAGKDEFGLRFRAPSNGPLSCFEVELDQGNVVSVSLDFESNYCFSLTFESPDLEPTLPTNGRS